MCLAESGVFPLKISLCFLFQCIIIEQLIIRLIILTFSGKECYDMINITNDNGNICITDDVFTVLAGDAATSCFGVKGMAGRSKEGGALQLLRRESMSKGVVVHYNDENDSISLELHIGVDQGVNMAAVSRSIMKEVRYKLQNSTGVPVNAVDVYIDTIIG